jgi:hypothetical protein
MVQHGLSEVHPKTGASILARNTIKKINIQSFEHIQNPTSTNPMESIVGDLFALMMG